MKRQLENYINNKGAHWPLFFNYLDLAYTRTAIANSFFTFRAKRENQSPVCHFKNMTKSAQNYERIKKYIIAGEGLSEAGIE